MNTLNAIWSATSFENLLQLATDFFESPEYRALPLANATNTVYVGTTDASTCELFYVQRNFADLSGYAIAPVDAAYGLFEVAPESDDGTTYFVPDAVLASGAVKLGSVADLLAEIRSKLV